MSPGGSISHEVTAGSICRKTAPRGTALLCWILAILLLAGCAAEPEKKHDRQTRTAGNGGDASASVSQAGRLVDAARDPPPPLNVVFQVEVYQLSVPLGTFSGNEPFWQRINEQCVDVATYDLLYKNGIRVGEAPLREFAAFRKYLAEVVPAQKLTVTAVEVKNVEISMKKDLPEQTIFYFDDANRPIGHSFDRCENLLTMSFQPAPRRPGHLRLTLCPVVRSLRKMLVYNPQNEPRQIEFVHPERLYDLNMRVDIPRDSFLVVTASSDALRPTSIGRAFLTIDGPAERMEQVLLVIPKPYIPSETPAR